MSELAAKDAPATTLGRVMDAGQKRPDSLPASNPIDVFLSGQRLHITADVDLTGIRKLKRMLEKYEEILALDEDVFA
jgi:hypothetical protein